LVSGVGLGLQALKSKIQEQNPMTKITIDDADSI